MIMKYLKKLNKLIKNPRKIFYFVAVKMVNFLSDELYLKMCFLGSVGYRLNFTSVPLKIGTI